MTTPPRLTAIPMPTPGELRAWAGSRRVGLIVIHHAAAGGATAAGVARWHMTPPPNGRGWRDIGYHLMVDDAGRVWTGRPLREVGAHAAPHNTGSVGICYLGDARRGMPWDAECAMVALTEMCCLAWGLEADHVRGHGELSGTSTECPGLPTVDGIAGMDRFRAALAARLGRMA
jgi:hypothetical protein